MELYRKYRPKRFADVLGQEKTIKAIQDKLEQKSFPHASLFCGPSGCGKTTTARILKKKLNCIDKMDYQEIDCGAVDEPIQAVREIKTRMSSYAAGGAAFTRIWLLDEVQALSKSRFAQQAMLNMLEETPSHVYFFLSTTEPDKLIKPIRTRCMTFEFKSVGEEDLKKLLLSVLEKEQKTIADEVIARLIECCGGSPRKILVDLDKVIGLTTEEQLESIQPLEAERQAIELARLLMGKKNWSVVAKVLSEVKDEPETIRRLVLRYARKILLSGSRAASRAFLVINVFECHFFDSGEAGLAAACWRAWDQMPKPEPKAG